MAVEGRTGWEAVSDGSMLTVHLTQLVLEAEG